MLPLGEAGAGFFPVAVTWTELLTVWALAITMHFSARALVPRFLGSQTRPQLCSSLQGHGLLFLLLALLFGNSTTQDPLVSLRDLHAKLVWKRAQVIVKPASCTS